jgi:hypothetical protein
MQEQTQYPVINWNKAAAKASDQIEFFALACTPHDEECTQAGMDKVNNDQQRIECSALINQLIRISPPPPGAEFFIIENTGHEFGIYYEAGIFFVPSPEPQTEQETDQQQSDSENYAMIIEGNIPDKWDAVALQELRDAGHPKFQPAKIVQMNAA